MVTQYITRNTTKGCYNLIGSSKDIRFNFFRSLGKKSYHDKYYFNTYIVVRKRRFMFYFFNTSYSKLFKNPLGFSVFCFFR